MALFNFLYKNESLIQSLYSQIFSGQLQSIETQETGRLKETGDVEGGMPPIVKGNMAREQSNEKTHRTVMLPHDSTVHDVLVSLAPRMKHVVEESDFGDILRTKGNIYIIPSDVEINALDVIFQTYVNDMDMRGLPKQAKPAVEAFLKKVLISTEPGCRFLFFAESGEFLRGFLPPDGMQETQKALIFKHGMRAIPTEIVALFEECKNPTNSITLPPQSILGGLHTMSAMVNELYLKGLPPSYPVTPVVIFYRLNDTEDFPEQPKN